MPLSLRELRRHAKEYVAIEAHAKVLSVRFTRRLRLFGREDVILSVRIDDRKDPEWWVIGGSTPMNLYSKRMFPDPDIAYSLHHGLMLRMADRGYEESSTAPELIGYDAFISHASEDKAGLVKPLAMALAKLGYRIWYDEFELRVGDSLRQSIDKRPREFSVRDRSIVPRVLCQELATVRTQRTNGAGNGGAQGNLAHLAFRRSSRCVGVQSSARG